MPRHAATATTRTVSRAHARPSASLLEHGVLVSSVESGVTYRIGRLLGAGGFGQVFLATREGRSSAVPETVCVKVSTRMDGWLREAYFGLLLQDHPRAIRVFDTFPFLDSSRRVLYCLAIEYACHGDLSAFLARHPGHWSERAVRREIAGLLLVLGKLHRGQLLHRDLTPLNVFVCDKHRLKLGDFGIVRQQSDQRGVTARTLNPLMAPSDIFDGAAPKWQARDDVYQVGQLIGMLVKGDATRRVRPSEVRSLSCSDQLKEIIYRCIGERRKRYESADELIRALDEAPAPMRMGAVRSLKGVHLAFTGILGVPRAEAVEAARRDRAHRHLGQDDGRREGTSQSAAGGGQGWRAEVDGDQAPAREGSADYAAERGAVLEAGPPGPPRVTGVTAHWLTGSAPSRRSGSAYLGRAPCRGQAAGLRLGPRVHGINRRDGAAHEPCDLAGGVAGRLHRTHPPLVSAEPRQHLVQEHPALEIRRGRPGAALHRQQRLEIAGPHGVLGDARVASSQS